MEWMTRMGETILCPDCGGVIAGEMQPGTQACRCSLEDLPRSEIPSPKSVEKLCCHCGKDVSHSTRYHDSRGYWCPDCHRLDKLETAPQGEPCAACSRVVPAAKLFADQGQRICGRCLREREEERRKPKAITFSRARHEHEKKRALILLAIALAFLLLVVLASFGLFR